MSPPILGDKPIRQYFPRCIIVLYGMLFYTLIFKLYLMHYPVAIVIHDKSSPFKFWLLDMAFIHDIGMCVCLSVCSPPRPVV